MTPATKAPGISERDLRDQWTEDIRERFAEHEATLGEGTDVIVFRRPGTRVYSVTYRVQGWYLIVTGDLGEAIYEWGEPIGWPFLAGCNWGYFASKCVASAKGCNARGWDSRVALHRLAYHLPDELVEEHDGDPAAALAELAGDIDLWPRTEPDLTCRDQWHGWLREYGDEVLGSAWWEWAPTVGDVPDYLMLAQWVGLQEAVERLGVGA